MIASQNVVEEAVADSTTGDDFDSLLAMSLANVGNISEQTSKHREKQYLASGRSVNKHPGETAASVDNELNIFPEEEEGELFSDDEQKAAGRHCGLLSSEYKREDSIHSSKRLSSYRSQSGSETDSESTGFATGSNSDLQYYGKLRNSSHSNSPVKHKSKLAHRLGNSISPQSRHKSAKFRLGTKQDAIPTLESVAPRVDPTLSVPEDLSSFSEALKTGRISTNSNRDEVWVKSKKAVHKSKDKNSFLGVLQHSTTRELTTLSRAPKMKSKGNKVLSKIPGNENRGAFGEDDDYDFLGKYTRNKSTRKVTMCANSEQDLSTSKERSSSVSRERSLNLHSGLTEKRPPFDKKRLMKMAIEESSREERKNHPYTVKGVKAKDTSWKNLSSSSDDDFVDPNMIRRKSLKSVKKERSPRKGSRRKEKPSSKLVSSKKHVRSAIVLADFTNSPSVAEHAETPQTLNIVDQTQTETTMTEQSAEVSKEQCDNRAPEDCVDAQAKRGDPLLPKDSIEDVSSASEVEAGEEKEEILPAAVIENPSQRVPEEVQPEAKLQPQKVRNIRNPSFSSSSSSGSDSSDDSSSDSSSSSDGKGSRSSSSSSSSSDSADDQCQNERTGPGSNRHQKMTIVKSGVSQNISRKRQYSSETDTDSDSEGGETMRCVVQRLPLEPKQVHAMRSKSPAAQSMLIPEIIPRKAPSSVSDIYRLEKTRLGIAKDPPLKLASKVDSNSKSLASSVGSNEDGNDKSVASKSPSDESGNKETNPVKIEAEVLDIPKPWRKTENPAKQAKPSPSGDNKKPSSFRKNEGDEKPTQSVARTKTTVTELVVTEPKPQKDVKEITPSSSQTPVTAVPTVSAELSTVCNTSNVYQTPILMSNPFVAVDQQQHTLVHMPLTESTSSDPFGLTCNAITPIPGVPMPVLAPVPPPAATVTFCDDYGNQPFYQLANQNPEPLLEAANLAASQPFYSLDQSSLQHMFPPPNLTSVGTNFVHNNPMWPDSQVMPLGPDFPMIGNGCGSFEPMNHQFVDPNCVTSHTIVSSSGADQNPIFPPKEPVFPPKEPVFPPKEPVFPPKEPVFPSKEPAFPPKEPVFPPKKPVFPPPPMEAFAQSDEISGNVVNQSPAAMEKPLHWAPEPPKGIKIEPETVVEKYLPWYDPNSGVAPSLSEMLPYFSRFWDVFTLQDNSDAKSARQVIVGLLESAIKYQESQGLRVEPQLKMFSELMKSFRNLENV